MTLTRFASRLLPHAGVDGHELDASLDLLLRTPGKSLGVELVLCAVLGQGLVVDAVQPEAAEHFLGTVSERDSHLGAGGKMALHPDEAFCVLLEIDHAGPAFVFAASSLS